MLEISLKLTFSTRSYSNYHLLMCHLSFPSVKNILNDAKSLTVHLWCVRNLYLHFMKSMLTLLGCILSQHPYINPFFSVPSSVQASWFLSGRVHLRFFKLTGYKCFHEHLFLCTGSIDNSASEFIFLLYKIQTITKISFMLKDKIPWSQSSKWHTSNKTNDVFAQNHPQPNLILIL